MTWLDALTVPGHAVLVLVAAIGFVVGLVALEVGLCARDRRSVSC